MDVPPKIFKWEFLPTFSVALIFLTKFSLGAKENRDCFIEIKPFARTYLREPEQTMIALSGSYSFFDASTDHSNTSLRNHTILLGLHDNSTGTTYKCFPQSISSSDPENWNEFSWLLNEDSLYCNFGIANNITVPLASEIENISMVDLFIQAGSTPLCLKNFKFGNITRHLNFTKLHNNNSSDDVKCSAACSSLSHYPAMDEQNLGDKLKNDRLVLTKRDANSANEFTTPVTFPLFRPLMLDVPESEAESESQERHPKQNDSSTKSAPFHTLNIQNIPAFEQQQQNCPHICKNGGRCVRRSMQPTNFKSTLSEKMIGLKRNICECSPGFLGANCNVIDVCKNETTCKRFGSEAQCIVDSTSMDNKAPEELTNAPHLCVCKDEMSDWVSCLDDVENRESLLTTPTLGSKILFLSANGSETDPGPSHIHPNHNVDSASNPDPDDSSGVIGNFKMAGAESEVNFSSFENPFANAELTTIAETTTVNAEPIIPFVRLNSSMLRENENNRLNFEQHGQQTISSSGPSSTLKPELNFSTIQQTDVNNTKQNLAQDSDSMDSFLPIPNVNTNLSEQITDKDTSITSITSNSFHTDQIGQTILDEIHSTSTHPSTSSILPSLPNFPFSSVTNESSTISQLENWTPKVFGIDDLDEIEGDNGFERSTQLTGTEKPSDEGATTSLTNDNDRTSQSTNQQRPTLTEDTLLSLTSTNVPSIPEAEIDTDSTSPTTELTSRTYKNSSHQTALSRATSKNDKVLSTSNVPTEITKETMQQTTTMQQSSFLPETSTIPPNKIHVTMSNGRRLGKNDDEQHTVGHTKMVLIAIGTIIIFLALALSIGGACVSRYIKRSRQLHGKYNPAKEESMVANTLQMHQMNMYMPSPQTHFNSHIGAIAGRDERLI